MALVIVGLFIHWYWLLVGDDRMEFRRKMILSVVIYWSVLPVIRLLMVFYYGRRFGGASLIAYLDILYILAGWMLLQAYFNFARGWKYGGWISLGVSIIISLTMFFIVGGRFV
jgi:hypothetical protein